MALQVSIEERIAVFRKCRQSLMGHARKSPSEILTDLTQDLRAELRADYYGAGLLAESFEKKIAHVLGFPASVFMPSGTMAGRKPNFSVSLHSFCRAEL